MEILKLFAKECSNDDLKVTDIFIAQIYFMGFNTGRGNGTCRRLISIVNK